MHTKMHSCTQKIKSLSKYTNLCISSSPVNTMNDINIDIGKPFSKSEKLKEIQYEWLEKMLTYMLIQKIL